MYSGFLLWEERAEDVEFSLVLISSVPYWYMAFLRLWRVRVSRICRGISLYWMDSNGGRAVCMEKEECVSKS